MESEVVVPPERRPEEENEQAEQRMVQRGLESSLRGEESSSVAVVSKAALVFASPETLLGKAAEEGTRRDDNDLPEVRQRDRLPACSEACSELLLPFSFWPQEQQLDPMQLVSLMLTRTVDGEALWERTGPAKEVAELSSHFRQLTGFQGGDESPVQRLRVTDVAMQALFQDTRVWADTKAGDFAGRQCQWDEIKLIIFRQGAILSVSIDWLAEKETFTLGDLRTWVYVCKHLATKVGVMRGWTFAKKERAHNVDSIKGELGLKLYAALYGGSCISLGSLANWLIKLPSEKTSSIPRRFSRFAFAHHHSYAAVAKPLEPTLAKEILWHIRKAYGSRLRRPVPDVDYAARFLPDKSVLLRGRLHVSVSSTGAVCIEEGGSSAHRLLWQGQWLALRRHCLAELTTLEKLLHLTAVHSQGLATGTRAHPLVQEQLMNLSSKLVQYRSSMASEDCGGPSEARLFFKMTRQGLQIGSLKEELFEQLQDVEYVLSVEHNEDLKIARAKEQAWRVKEDAAELRQLQIEESPKMTFDVLFFAFSAVVFPFVLFATLFGSNQADLPVHVSWGALLIAAAVLSALSLVGYAVIYYRSRKVLQRLEKQQKQHLDAGKRLFADIAE